MRNRLRKLCLLLAVLTIPINSIRAADVADFADFSLRDSAGNVLLPGRLYIPPQASANPNTPRPFILFLHGGGEEGTNNVSQINSNIDNLLAEAKLKGAYLYAPQSTSTWNSVALTNNVMTMIDGAEADMDVDVSRLYITGLSNGGGGTWDMLSRYPGQFAAAIPISGIAPASDFVASHLLNEPVFAFHARDDPTVSVTTTQNVLNSILAAAQEPLPSYPSSRSTADFLVSNPDVASHHAIEQIVAQQGTATGFNISGTQLDLMYYELAVGGHNIWSGVYSQPPVYDWLFSHSLTVPEPMRVESLLLGVVGFAAASRGRKLVSRI